MSRKILKNSENFAVLVRLLTSLGRTKVQEWIDCIQCTVFFYIHSENILFMNIVYHKIDIKEELQLLQ